MTGNLKTFLFLKPASGVKANTALKTRVILAQITYRISDVAKRKRNTSSTFNNIQHSVVTRLTVVLLAFLECSFYKVLDELDRAQGYIGVGKCDRSLLKGWYRFQRHAGKQMPQSCVRKQRCGTDAPGWLAEGHPKKRDGAVKRKVRFHWSYSCCRFSSYIRVRNCGTFYVYELDSTRFCSLRYCGDGM